MPWTHSTNWSRSPRSPDVGRRISRMTIPAASATRSARSGRPDRRRAGASIGIGSDPAGDPVPLGRAIDLADPGDRAGMRPDRVSHLDRTVEQPLDLALVQGDAADLALELVGDVRVLGEDAHVAWQARERGAGEVIDAVEVGPPRVWEVLV